MLILLEQSGKGYTPNRERFVLLPEKSMSSELEQEIQKKVHALPEPRQHDLLTLIDEFLGEAAEGQSADARPIWEIFEGLSQQVALEDWSKLPSDGAEEPSLYARRLHDLALKSR